jgi:hypothetical protein
MVKRKLFLALVALLSACAAPVPPTTPSLTQASLAPTLPPAATNVRVTDTSEYEIPQLLPFDGIPPVYDPQFASAEEAPLLDDELVMGIALDGEAKAYPVTVLRFREMVDDELAGIPIPRQLVTDLLHRSRARPAH